MSVEPTQLNDHVRPILLPFLAGNYQLSEEGQSKVIEANAQLDEEYANAHNLPVADWCFDDIQAKLNVLKPKEFGNVLDVCAGTGYVALNVMRKKLFKKCIALDINPDALKILERRANRMGIEGIETQIGNIMDTDYPSNSFDCVMGNAFLHHLPDNKTFLSEMYRILKPGGVVCFTGEPSVSGMRYENFVPRLVYGLVGQKHGPRGPIPLTDIWVFRREPVEQLFSELGFKDVKVVGHGRWSVAVHTFLDRLWIRFFKRAAPAWIGWITYKFKQLGMRLRNVGDVDTMAGFSISARK